MEPKNNTQISEFHLFVFSEEPELQPSLFGLFLFMYLVIIFGNLLIILATITDSCLHTIRYLFLSNLSIIDICFISTTTPRMLVNIQTQSKVISYAGCLTQMNFFMLFAALDDILLTVMAYNHFMLICHPLHYMVIMKPQLSVLLVLGSWTISLLNSFLECLLVLQLCFCTHLEILHFFCELKQVVQLACSDTFINDLVMNFATGLLGVGPLAGILFSYSKIVSSICAISSAQGNSKAFSICASHLSVVFLFYCSSLGVNFRPTVSHNIHSSAPGSVMYTMVTPMLNPFLYSLRNKDIKRALKRFFGK